MLSTVLVSRSLIVGAKINKIQEEYRMFNGAVSMFSDVYSCLPGDCPLSQITDISLLIPTLCHTPPVTPIVGAHYGSVNTGSIESAKKRTCMMLELQAAGYISGLIMPVTATEAFLGSSSTVNGNIPYAKFSRQAAWDYRLVTPALNATTTNSLTYPIVNGLLAGSLASWAGFHQLTLRDSSATSMAGTTTAPIGDIVSTTGTTAGNFATYPMSANLAQKLDLKFDDGMPYSGNISSGRNVAQASLTFLPTTAVCTNLTAASGETLAANVVATQTYVNSNDTNRGCLISYLM
jgi:hypothetical protein